MERLIVAMQRLEQVTIEKRKELATVMLVGDHLEKSAVLIEYLELQDRKFTELSKLIIDILESIKILEKG